MLNGVSGYVEETYVAMAYRQPLGSSGGHYNLRVSISQQSAKSQPLQLNSSTEMNSVNNLNKLGIRFFPVERPEENTAQQLLDCSLIMYFVGLADGLNVDGVEGGSERGESSMIDIV